MSDLRVEAATLLAPTGKKISIGIIVFILKEEKSKTLASQKERNQTYQVLVSFCIADHPLPHITCIAVLAETQCAVLIESIEVPRSHILVE